MLHVILLLGCAVTIYLACEAFVNAVEWLGVRMKVGPVAVGTILAAVGTALPESVVTLVAVLFGGQLPQVGVRLLDPAADPSGQQPGGPLVFHVGFEPGPADRGLDLGEALQVSLVCLHRLPPRPRPQRPPPPAATTRWTSASKCSKKTSAASNR